MTTGDYVEVTDGKLQGKRGLIVRASEDSFCVVIRSVWDHGIWFLRSNLRLTKKGKRT